MSREPENQATRVTEADRGAGRRRAGPGQAWVWALAVVVSVFILTGGVVVLKLGGMLKATVDDGIQAISGLFKPKVTVERVISSTLDELTRESKLVVLTAEITVCESRSSRKKLLWDQLDLGDTVVELRVPGNKVQYVLPTAAITRDSFHWDGARNTVRLDLPDPVLDEALVEIQSDPTRIEVRKEIGWGRLEAFSGDYLEQQIRRDLRALVLHQGQQARLRAQARQNAVAAVQKIFFQLLQAEDVNLSVQLLIKDSPPHD